MFSSASPRAIDSAASKSLLSTFARRLTKVALIAGAAAGLQVAPSLAETKIRAAMLSVPQILDPNFTVAWVSQYHGLMIYDVLFAVDMKGNPQPQMVDKYEVSDDGSTYKFTLRSGLKFSDGTPVKAADCVASLKRWGSKDIMGMALISISTLTVIDDNSFELKLSQPFGDVIGVLGKAGSRMPFIMPERLALTSPDQQITDTLGSGPFVFRREDWVPGTKAVYVRNPHYVPRSEPPDNQAGSRAARVDVVEWVTIPDPNTALSALQNGEIDYYQVPPPDFIPVLAADPNIELKNISRLGTQGWIRPNHLNPPFDNPLARRALLHLVDQEKYMRAIGFPPGTYRQFCGALMMCGGLYESTAGTAAFAKPDPALAKKMLAEAGYRGERIVLLQPIDPILTPVGQVLAQDLRSIGVNVDLQSMDWSAIFARRAQRAPVAEGGWNIVLSFEVGESAAHPLGNLMLASNCEKANAGWPCDAEFEKIRLSAANAKTPADRKAIADALQLRAYEHVVPYISFGQYSIPIAVSKRLSGVSVTSVPTFWNIEKK